MLLTSTSLEPASVNGDEQGILVLEPLFQRFDLPSIVLPLGRITLGSGENCTFRFRAEGVQPLHCVIESNPHRTVLSAEDSQTWHNGDPVLQTDLHAGDQLRIGSIEFRIRAATRKELLRLIPEEFSQEFPSPAGNRPLPPPQPLEQVPDIRTSPLQELRNAIAPPRRAAEAKSEGTLHETPPESDPRERLSEGRLEASEGWQTPRNPSAGLHQEVAELVRQIQQLKADLDAKEQAFEEEMRKIRAQLAREQMSVAMESALLREHQSRMNLRERALNAQRRELEDRERLVIQRENGHTVESGHSKQSSKEVETKQAELAQLDQRR